MSSSLSRAFTTRRVKLGLDLKETKDFLTRRESTKTNSIIRPKISGPVQLVHTTNMMSYNAPDIEAQRRSPSSSHSIKSDSDSLTSPASTSTSPPTSPEASICERPTTPEMFDITPSPRSPKRSRTVSEMPPPAIPHRAPSHTKKASINASHHRSGSINHSVFLTQSPTSVVPPSPSRSVVSKSSMTLSRSSTTSTGTATTSVSSSFAGMKSPGMPVYSMTVSEARSYESPFGQELAQVAELAEDFGIKHKLEVIDEEERELTFKGLRKHHADSYIKDVSAIRLSFFPDSIPLGGVRPAPVWI